ncbi:hypothetical protein [Limnobacter sp.]|uniref:hypothetical protein n=1 Tax=Limnobacter sp. TaxID=2003368 RepID=UPI0025C3A35C|nr:hypothetical protein [Limnobacter sp.]
MKMTRQSRNYAETVGHAVAFGICMTKCDVFQDATMTGYIHGVREPNEAQLDIKHAFTQDAFEHWTRMMRLAEDLAYKRGHDTCDYGVVISRLGDKLFMSLARHSYFQHKALDHAEAEMTESAVYDLSNYDTPLYLEEHNRMPGTPNEFWSMREAGEYAHIPYDDEYNVQSKRAV